MKTIITALGFLFIIGMDCSIRTIDFLNACDVNIELTKESSSESESKEKSEKNLGDYIEELANHLKFKNEFESNNLLAIEFKAIFHHNPWDEIPSPPPEYS